MSAEVFRCAAVTKSGRPCPVIVPSADTKCTRWHNQDAEMRAQQGERGKLGGPASSRRRLALQAAVLGVLPLIELRTEKDIQFYLEIEASAAAGPNGDPKRLNGAAAVARAATIALDIAKLKAENLELRKLLAEKYPHAKGALKAV